MGLRARAQADALAILTDDAAGFGWECLVANPDGEGAAVKGFTTDVDAVIDPETGVAVKGRTVTATFAIADLEAAGFDTLPTGISDETRKPWTVEITDLSGNTQLFAVREGRPDRTLGVVVCVLEFHSLAPAG